MRDSVGPFQLPYRTFMRAALLKVVFWTAMVSLGLLGFLLTPSEPWKSVAFAFPALAFVMALYAIRDLAYAVCTHFQSRISKAAVFTHVCAVTIAASVYFLTFSSADPRVDSVKWPLLILLPLSVYLLSYLYDLVFSLRDTRAPKQKRARKKRPPAL